LLQWPISSLFSAFLLASVVLAVTPGPGVLYLVTRSLVQGRRSGLVSVAARALHGRVVRRIGRRLAGGVFIGLGVFTALAGSRGAR
jgi:threonine/homoserine/homoserine lactone efflux protein